MGVNGRVKARETTGSRPSRSGPAGAGQETIGLRGPVALRTSGSDVAAIRRSITISRGCSAIALADQAPVRRQRFQQVRQLVSGVGHAQAAVGHARADVPGIDEFPDFVDPLMDDASLETVTRDVLAAVDAMVVSDLRCVRRAGGLRRRGGGAECLRAGGLPDALNDLIVTAVFAAVLASMYRGLESVFSADDHHEGTRP
jgi:hypothetical protein